MHSNTMFAVGALIQQQTRAQLARTWEMHQADNARRSERFSRIADFFGRIVGLAKMNFDLGVPREARV